MVSPNLVAACSNCLHISVTYSSVWATIAASSANSSSRMQSSRVFMLAFSLANLNSFPSDLSADENSCTKVLGHCRQ